MIKFLEFHIPRPKKLGIDFSYRFRELSFLLLILCGFTEEIKGQCTSYIHYSEGLNKKLIECQNSFNWDSLFYYSEGVYQEMEENEIDFLTSRILNGFILKDNLGIVYEYLGKQNKVSQYLKNNSHKSPTALNFNAWHSFKKGNLKESIYYSQLAKDLNELECVVDTLNYISTIYLTIKANRKIDKNFNVDTLIKAGEDLLRGLKFEYYPYKVKFLYEKGLTFRKKLKLEEALSVFEYGLHLTEKVLASDDELISNFKEEIGYIYNRLGKLTQALMEYNEVSRRIPKGQNSRREAELHYKIGILQSNMAPEKAIWHFQKSQTIFNIINEGKNSYEQLDCQSSLALAYEVLGKYDSSIKYLKLAEIGYNKLKPSPSSTKALLYMNIGRALDFLGNEPGSIKYFNKSIDTFSMLTNDSDFSLVLPLYFLSKLHLKKNPNLALLSLRKALKIIYKEPRRNPLIKSFVFSGLTKAYLNIANFDSAAFYLDQVYKCYFPNTDVKFSQSNIPIKRNVVPFKDIINLLNLKSEILTQSGLDSKSILLLDQSISNLDLSIDILDSIRVEILEQEMTYRLDESFEQVYFNGIDLSSYLYLTQKKSIYLEKAFKIFQKRQNNRLLGRIIKAKNFKANSDPYKFENYFDREIRIIESQIRYFLNKKELGKVQYLKDQKFTLENKRDSLLFNEQLSNSEDFIDRYKTPVIELSSFQATLSPSETLLEYFRTDTALYAFAINREDVSFQKLDLPENFDPELDQFLVNSKSPPKNNTAFKEYYAGKAHELYQTLVEPLLDSLKAIPHQETSQLIIVPDGKLGYLPWDALLTEMPSDVHDYRNYPLLLKKFSIRQAYSATLMKLLEEKEMEEKSLMAAFAPAYMTKSQLAQILKSGGGEICGPPDEERFEELSQSSQELDEILTHIKGARFDTLNASETRFKEIANDFRILHLTMHGFTDDCDPMYSGLVFTPRSMLEAAGISDTTNPTNEGILHAYEIYNMRLNAELVVMSACQTGLGKIQAGEGIMSLARAFAHAGSPNTVMSLWQVQESSTRKLMENFYEYLDAGKGKDEALRLAKLDFINGNGIAHPFYWAGFTLIGDDKPIVEDNWFQKNWWMLAIGLVLLLGIYAVLRKYSSSART